MLADDLVQETLTKALKKSTQLREPQALQRWLRSILVNCWRDHHRARRDFDDIDHCQLVDPASPEQRYEQQSVTEQVRGALAALPEGQRLVLSLVDLEGASYAEVAEALQIPIGTVMSRLCRARNALAGLLVEPQAHPQTKTHALKQAKGLG